MKKSLDFNVFDAIFKNSSIGMIIIDKYGSIVNVNDFTNNLFGYSEDELIGQKIEVLLPDDLKKKHVGLRDGYINAPKVRPMGAGLDLRALRKDKSEFKVEISLSSYKVEDDTFVISFVNDVTRRKEMEFELENKNKELEETVNQKTKDLKVTLSKLESVNEDLRIEVSKSEKNAKIISDALRKEKDLNEMKSRFVSMASHEFRTPLAGIMSSASLISRYKTEHQDDKRQKHIRNIKKSVRNLTVILNDFLSLDKLENDKVKTQKHEFDLLNLIDEVALEFSEVLKKGQSISIQHENLRENLINQDKDILRNILINLISNAIKYSNEDDEIVVTLSNKTNLYEVSIQDFGIGIPSEDQKNLFGRFFRAGNVSNIQGTGLGLNIVKKYIEMIGGSISFESEKDFGTTFLISFKGD